MDPNLAGLLAVLGIYGIYGPVGCGKTRQLASAFPGALFYCSPGALASVESDLGFTPAQINELRTLPEILGDMRARTDDGSLRAFTGACIDDASPLLDNSMVVWREAAPTNDRGKEDKYYAFNQHDRCLSEAKYRMEISGLPICLSFHETEILEESGVVKRRVQPRVASMNKTEVLPAVCTSLLHMEDDPAPLDPYFPARFFGQALHPRIQAKERWGILSAVRPYGPANLRELLNEAVRKKDPTLPRLPRLAGLEWQDDWAEWVAGQLRDGGDVIRVAESAFDQLNGYDERHVQWAIQDGIARHLYRAGRVSPRQALHIRRETSGATGGGKLPPPPPPAAKK